MSKRRHREQEKEREEPGSSDDGETAIDFSVLREKTTRAWGKASSLGKKFLTPAASIIILLVILIILSTYVRMGPATLPITDQWASATLSNNIQNNIYQQVKQQRPELPEASIRQITQNEYAAFYQANKAQIDAQTKALSLQFKAELQNDHGMTHILGIDEYLWYSYAKWYDRNNYFGTQLVDGKPRFLLRYGRFGQSYYFIFPSYSINLLHDFLKLFNPGRTVEQTAFYIALVLMALVTIPAFFLGKKLSGNVGGFFAAAAIAVSGAIVARTLVGAPESDGYTVLFPLLVTWLFFEALDSKSFLRTYIFSAVAGLACALFYFYWGGWWFTLLLVIGTAAIYIVYYAVLRRMKKEKIFNRDVLREVLVPVIFIVPMMIFAALIGVAVGRNVGAVEADIVKSPLAPINFITGFKAAAQGNVIGEDYALWPNVLRTVAELNQATLKQVIASPGSLTLGKLTIPFFWLGLLGILLLFLRFKEDPKYPFYGAFLLIWLLSTLYAGVTGIRFMVLVNIVVAFGIGSLVSYVAGPAVNLVMKSSGESRKKLLKWVFIILLFFALIWVPMKNSRAIGESTTPIFDDAWYEAMQPIKDDPNPAIITSWWDYGHFFQAESEKTVTFDGGDQGLRIYWVGKSLSTSDEHETVDILKMLNCGEEEGYNRLRNYTNDQIKATKLILSITREAKEDAAKTLKDAGLTDEETASVLEMTHCSDLYGMYFVTSADMVGKASVWGYFGNWNFDRAYFYYKLKNLPLPEAMNLAALNLGYTNNQTREIYNAAKKITNEDDAASWISTYPNYMTSSPVPCTRAPEADTVVCDYNILLSQQPGANIALTRGVFNLTNESYSMFIMQAVNTATNSVISQNAVIPAAIVGGTGKDLTRMQLDNPNFGYDFVIYELNGKYYSLIAHEYLSASIFTRLFFMNGKYTEHFEKVSDITSFRGERIIVWKVRV
jgi:dolichyl-diphosphooligosaccharide--protein glycosyltransferase